MTPARPKLSTLKTSPRGRYVLVVPYFDTLSKSFCGVTHYSLLWQSFSYYCLGRGYSECRPLLWTLRIWWKRMGLALYPPHCNAPRGWRWMPWSTYWKGISRSWARSRRVTWKGRSSSRSCLHDEEPLRTLKREIHLSLRLVNPLYSFNSKRQVESCV